LNIIFWAAIFLISNFCQKVFFCVFEKKNFFQAFQEISIPFTQDPYLNAGRNLYFLKN